VRGLGWVEPPASIATLHRDFFVTDMTLSWVEATPNPFA
jgi:hypothetical protein